jgi:hypothetical protein
MTLFADMPSVGLATAVACLPLLTAPAALSTARAVLRGAREDRPASAGLAPAGAGLPGTPLFAVTAAAIGAYATLAALRARARPESLDDWPAALREAARDAVRDLGGSGLVLLAVATAAVCAWVLVPPAFLAPGPPAMALTAVDVRRAVVAGPAASAPGG